ncbi:hypothetical protein C6501_14050 [Candidatus Poribacteria bacterium]|nr:MAG: hypothetical protein C6501_14050 [Candidatus Poribacteria bacterium]
MNLHEALEKIRQRVGHNEATSYTKAGCQVSMANIPSERVVLDVDLAFPVDRALTNQCDFVLFYIDTAPAQEQVAFREYESPLLQANQIRGKSQFGAAKHGSEMASYIRHYNDLNNRSFIVPGSEV